MPYRTVVFLVFIILTHIVSVQAQTDTLYNQTDAKNLKQGYWKKTFPNGKLMYKGFFKDGKPVGDMRRYYESGAIKAIMLYDQKSEYAHTRLFYENGGKAAEGWYFGNQKDSCWTYYSFYDHSVSSRECYVKGMRHGMMINYYSNGEISEKIEWKNNMKDGSWEQYFAGNITKLKATYRDDKLEGDFRVNLPDGKPYVTGMYQNNMRHGTWTFYNEDGTLKKELHYTDGKATEELELTGEEQEFFRMIDENQGKFDEPDETNFLTPGGR